jgi:exodeoxyribonuclease-5
MFIIDECSMVDTRLGQDLLSFNVPVLVLGDPAQLPPVGSGGFFTKQAPDFLLTDIHRQAENDPIITLANIVREGGNLEPGTYGESQVCNKAALHQDDWLEADQILCGLNKTRHAINKRCRELLGFTAILPEPGEKLVCLKNNSDDELLNGSLWECTESVDNGGSESFVLKAKSLDDEGRTVSCVVNKCNFLGIDGDLYEARRTNSFDFGYALTVHKAQGSQWDTVILMDEWSREFRKEWLYTGVTRAAKSITVVQR